MTTNALTRKNFLAPSFADEFFKPLTDWFENAQQTRLTVPAVNITENNNGYNIIVVAPGMKKDDFHIHINNKVLTISAEAEQNEAAQADNYTRREYNYSSFSRSFTLPDEVNEDTIEAVYEDGVLKLSLPKRAEAQKPATKTIEVR